MSSLSLSVRQSVSYLPKVILSILFIDVSFKGDTELSQAVMTTPAGPQIHARRAGFIRDVISVAIRALRGIPRDPEAIYPALIIPVFFYAINIGALQDVAERIPGVDYKAFQLPVGIIFAVTGVSRAVTMVTDIQSGYFDRLSLTPINRLAMLLGFTVADLVLVMVLTVPVVVLGLAVGVRFETGILGLLLFVLLSGLWGLAYTGFPYAIAFKTGNPAAVNSSFLALLPVRVPDHRVRAAGGDDGLDGDNRRIQPGYIPAGRAAVAYHRRLGLRGACQGRRGDRAGRWCERHAGADGAARQDTAEVVRQ